MPSTLRVIRHRSDLKSVISWYPNIKRNQLESVKQLHHRKTSITLEGRARVACGRPVIQFYTQNGVTSTVRVVEVITGQFRSFALKNQTTALMLGFVQVKIQSRFAKFRYIRR